MKKRAVLLSALTLLALIGGLIYILNFRTRAFKSISESPSVPVILPQKPADSIMSLEEMKVDMDYIIEKLKNVHPKSIQGFSKEQEKLIENAYGRINNPMKVGEFYFIANEVVSSFEDAHTRISIQSTEKDRRLNLPMVWLKEGLYVSADAAPLMKGDKILSIGNLGEEELLKEMKKIIPSENDYFIKVFTPIDIIQESFLRHLNMLKEDKVPITIERDGKRGDYLLGFRSEKANSSDKNGAWFSYNIYKEDSLGVFTINQCSLNGSYKTFLNNFFEEVYKENIKNIAIDVRNNMGGDSRVINEFIKYLDVKQYKDFSGTIRYSKEAVEQRGYEKDSGVKDFNGNVVKNEKVENKNLIFKGKVYVLTSNITFSSANWFGVIFKDNKVGTILGEPTGNAPSSYGDILSFQTPNAKLVFSVSHKKWIRPDKEKNNDNTLFPDIEVYTTAKDIIEGRDAQIEKLKTIIKD